ncbi:hypothetical protein [Synechococcus sp. UW140]|uniref:hypothetical protein n=1 Tax=Synechococcus sp. UW140 TaxID=368503 RepID=UPI00148370F5|nr:hypothetical protein [Synechococcus sp. UW140]
MSSRLSKSAQTNKPYVQHKAFIEATDWEYKKHGSPDQQGDALQPFVSTDTNQQGASAALTNRKTRDSRCSDGNNRGQHNKP